MKKYFDVHQKLYTTYFVPGEPEKTTFRSNRDRDVVEKRAQTWGGTSELTVFDW